MLELLYLFFGAMLIVAGIIVGFVLGFFIIAVIVAAIKGMR